jgi:hypothetical protein
MPKNTTTILKRLSMNQRTETEEDVNQDLSDINNDSGDESESQSDSDEPIQEPLPKNFRSPDYGKFSLQEIRDALIYNLDYKHNRKPGSRKYDIRSLLLYFKKEINDAADRMAIALSDSAITHYMATNFANMKLKDYIADQYWGYVSCLIEFFLLIGDYDSLLILLPNPPQNTPSPDVESCVQFTQYKGFEVDQKLMTQSGESLKDICGDDIFCLGLWHT